MVLISNIIIRLIIKGLASASWIFYFGTMIDLIGTYSFAVSGAMLSYCIPNDEFGKVFAIIEALESLLPIGIVQAYAQIWKVQINK